MRPSNLLCVHGDSTAKHSGYSCTFLACGFIDGHGFIDVVSYCDSTFSSISSVVDASCVIFYTRFLKLFFCISIHGHFENVYLYRLLYTFSDIFRKR